GSRRPHARPHDRVPDLRPPRRHPLRTRLHRAGRDALRPQAPDRLSPRAPSGRARDQEAGHRGRTRGAAAQAATTPFRRGVRDADPHPDRRRAVGDRRHAASGCALAGPGMTGNRALTVVVLLFAVLGALALVTLESGADRGEIAVFTGDGGGFTGWGSTPSPEGDPELPTQPSTMEPSEPARADGDGWVPCLLVALVAAVPIAAAVVRALSLSALRPRPPGPGAASGDCGAGPGRPPWRSARACWAPSAPTRRRWIGSLISTDGPCSTPGPWMRTPVTVRWPVWICSRPISIPLEPDRRAHEEVVAAAVA